MTTDPAAETPPILSFIGAGRAAAALAVAARDAGYRIAAITGHRPERAAALAELTGARAVPTAVAAASTADITIVAVPDGTVLGVAATIAAAGLALEGRALVHTAARLGPDALAAARLTGARVGVLHPLQALRGAASAELLRGAYYRIEAAGRLREQLDALVCALGGHVLAVPGDARSLYHAAAVLAGNAPLALLARAEAVLQLAGVDAASAHAALAPLFHGAATNALADQSAAVLTGPVARGDADAITDHLKALQRDAGARDLYLTLAREMARLVARDPGALGLDMEQPEASATAIRRVA